MKQQDTANLCRYLNQYVGNKLTCKADLFLAEPHYPLPGEGHIPTLPDDDAPALVKQAYKNRRVAKSHPNALSIAMPVITQGSLLGVILVEKPERFNPDEIQLLESLSAVAGLAMQVNRQVTLKNWRFDQISLVRSVSAQIANVFDIEELCMRVTNLIQCSFELYHVAIFTIDANSSELTFKASSLNCEPNTKNPLIAAEYGKGLIGKAARTGQEYIVDDVSRNSMYTHIEALPETKSEAVLPLKVEDRVLGVLDLRSEKKGAFHTSDMLVLRSLADTIALALNNTRLFNNLQQQASRISAVSEIGSAISSILDLDLLLKEVVSVIEKRFGIPYVHIFTVHSNRGKVIFEAGTGAKARNLKPTSWAFDLDAPAGILPHVARTGKSYISNDVNSDPLYVPSKNFSQKVKSELAVPLTFGNNVLGVLDLQTDKINYFTRSEQELFESLASGIAQSIRNATLFRTERWRRSVADSFRDTAGSLVSNLALPEMLDRVLSALEKNLPCDASAVWLLDDDTSIPVDDRPLRLAAVRGVSSKKITESTLSSITVRSFLNYGINSALYAIRKPGDPYGPLGAARKFKPGYSSLAVPLRSGEENLGVLTMAHRAEGRYGSEAADIALTLASYAAVAIQNAHLYTSAQEEAWSSTVLLQVAEAMQSINGVDSLLSTMTRLTPLLVGVEQCAIYLLKPDKETFEMKSWYGFQPAENEMIASDTESVAMLKLKATLAPVIIEDPKQELGMRSLQYSDKTSTLVLIPLMAHGELHGAFLVCHNSQGEFGVLNKFSDQTLAILQGIAQQTAVGLENILLLENRQEEAYITAVLLQVAQAVVSQNQLDDILDTIVQLMPILVGVDTCVIYLWDKNNLRFLPAKAVAPTHAEQDEIIRHTYSQGEFLLLDKLIETDHMIGCRLEKADLPIRSWRTLACQEEISPLLVENSNWLLGFPLSIKGEKYGVMLTRESNVQASYHQKRVELIKGVAQQTALAIQNERLKEEMVGRERVEREFQLARQIQKTFLPQSIPGIQGWDFDLRWRTAREVGGDFYDVFRTRNNKLAFAIADVSDKGMPAALYMTVTRTLIRSAVQTIESPDEVLKRVNELLYEESQNGMFVTAIFALLDPLTGILEYSNAGHNLPLLFRGKTQKVEKLKKGGIALGVVEDGKYTCHQVQIKEQDTLLLYTDGVTEAFSSSGEQFSESRVIDALQNNLYSSSAELLENLEDLINTFRKGEPPSDDLTMLAIHHLKETPA
ncbi:MAG TPA: GAF domain-containing protein [Anaerolineaceae bacterium]|nr:GAF domain-containing protein [Anaerolineaceae bacterium]